MKQAFQTVKKRWQTMLEERDYSSMFIAILLSSSALYLLLSLLSGGYLLPSVFFLGTEDAFMDFFNSIRDAAQGEAAYTDRHIIYPPMANLFFWLLSFVMPDSYNQTSFEDRKEWMREPIAIALICTFVVVCTLLLGLAVYKSLRGAKKKKWLFTLAVICSVPFLNLIERGNIMALCVIALLCFFGTYNSQNRFLRELGLLALAFSFSLKLYPILFAWILLADKRYKEIVRCAIYCLAMLILPCFFFGGLDIFLVLLDNVFSFSSSLGNNVGSFLGDRWQIVGVILTVLVYVPFVLCALNFMVAPWIHRERWKLLMIGCMAFLSFPPLASTYGWILFAIPMIAIFNDGVQKQSDICYIILMIIPFLFFPIPLPYITGNAIVVYVTLVAMTIVLVKDTIGQILQLSKQKQRSVSVDAETENAT